MVRFVLSVALVAALSVPGGAQLKRHVVVEVHESVAGGVMWSHVGVVEATQSINWGPSEEIGEGRSPMSDVEGDAVVEVHQGAEEGSTDLFYRVGKIDLKTMTISWGQAVKYDRGQRPNIALRDGIAVEVHQSHIGANLWYHVGKVDLENRRIDWGPSKRYDRGTLPSIGL